MMRALQTTPGNLIRARGRDWVVQSGSDDTVLALRPLRGSDEVVYLDPSLEIDPIEATTFADPNPDHLTNLRSGMLFREALMLKLRNGAGPFRSFGHIAVQPRTYQLVPLLMAMKMDPIRLLIADDVGIGKTIEAGLIVRELWDRYEIEKFAVLCPPHLVDQWVGELKTHFHFPAVALTASSVSSLERTLPMGQSLFDKYRVLVVSLDYIKNPVHRDNFLSTAPDCIIVDEAHTCTNKGHNQHLRYDLLKRLAAKKERSLIMLTATPHSGDDEAFKNLLGLLDEKYLQLGQDPILDKKLREELGSQFVQRRRMDIITWKDDSIFPTRMVKELSYTLTDEWKDFFEEVRVYCYNLAKGHEERQSKASRMIWYAILTLFRCVASSPASAISVLTTRLNRFQDLDEVQLEEMNILDDEAVDFTVDDSTPSEVFAETKELKKLLATAKRLHEKDDPKLNALVKHLKKDLLKDRKKDARKEGFTPVIFCRYISTAKYVGERLKTSFPNYDIDVVTGELTAEERQEHIDLLGQKDNPILVATDCLSEGINLQEHFNAVVHYDLAWNPTRHEQREGRVDRFGQKAPEVRCTMMYCEDNPIDGFIFKVIIKKASTIKKDLGILVPIPENNVAVEHALVKAALMKKSFKTTTSSQLAFDFGEIQEVTDEFEKPWIDALENAKKNQTIFAQNALHPEQVIPSWKQEEAALGSSAMVENLFKTLLARIGCPMQPKTPQEYRIDPTCFPTTLKDQVKDHAFEKPFGISFTFPPQVGSEFIHRSHPLVEVLSDYVLENTLDFKNQNPLGGRCSVIETTGVSEVYSLFLIRLRHQIATELSLNARHLMAEEVIVVASKGMVSPQWIAEEDALKLFDSEPSGTLSERVQRKSIENALAFYHSQEKKIAQICKEHADQLLETNRQVRSAASARGKVSVRPCFPADLMGVYVLLPSVEVL